jgi:hypothetical protein
MKLDETAKIASVVSVVVGLMISVAGYFTNLKLQSLQESVGKLNVTDKILDVSSKTDLLSAKLNFEFSLPLARSFAIQYSQSLSSKDQVSQDISFLTTELSEEFTKVYTAWEQRKGLMTGQACGREGLMARQVVTLIVQNIGHTDAVEISIKAMVKASPHSNPTTGWQELSANGSALAYCDLRSASATNGWEIRDLKISDLPGRSSPEKDGGREQVVLASVSGSKALFGTVLVPTEISWTDNITKVRKTKTMEVGKLRAALMGAEIGSLGTACP